MEPYQRIKFELVLLKAVGLQLGTIPLEQDAIQGNFLGLNEPSPPTFGETIFLLDILE